MPVFNPLHLSPSLGLAYILAAGCALAPLRATITLDTQTREAAANQEVALSLGGASSVPDEWIVQVNGKRQSASIQSNGGGGAYCLRIPDAALPGSFLTVSARVGEEHSPECLIQIRAPRGGPSRMEPTSGASSSFPFHSLPSLPPDPPSPGPHGAPVPERNVSTTLRQIAA
jgi:hypothetical protein